MSAMTADEVIANLPIREADRQQGLYATRDLLKRITPHATAESRAREARRRGIAIRVRPAQGWAALCGHATARDRGPEYDRHVRDCERRGGVAFAHTLDRQQVHGD